METTTNTWPAPALGERFCSPSGDCLCCDGVLFAHYPGCPLWTPECDYDSTEGAQ